MIDYVLLSIIAGLYVLGAYQGGVIADVVDESAGPDLELDVVGRFTLTWLWPYATLRAMWENGRD